MKKHRTVNTDGSCGWRALETVALHLGMKSLAKDLHRQHGGVTTTTIKRYLTARKIDFALIEYRAWWVIRKICAKGRPVAIGIPGHMVVCVGLDDKGVYIIDNTGSGARKVRRWTYEKFWRNWQWAVIIRGDVGCLPRILPLFPSGRPRQPRVQPGPGPRPGPYDDEEPYDIRPKPDPKPDPKPEPKPEPKPDPKPTPTPAITSAADTWLPWIAGGTGLATATSLGALALAFLRRGGTTPTPTPPGPTPVIPPTPDAFHGTLRWQVPKAG